MAFEKLKDDLQGAIKGLRKAVVVDKKTVREYIKEIQKTMLSSDMDVKLVFEMSKKIEERGLLESPPGTLSRSENLVRITYEELVKILGTGVKPEFMDGEKILLVGIQGSGKTTTVAKLAKYLKKAGLNPRVICADTFRPAAYDQLKQLAEEVDVPFYGEPREKNSLKIIENGISQFKKGVVLIDSEGRHRMNEDLMGQINKTYKQIKPDKTLLVLDGTIGQQAGKQADAFRQACGINGVILTKLDGSAKGGGALSACAATNSPIYFIGVGEHIEDFEEFDPERFVSKLIGFGDLQGLLEKAKEVEFDEEAAKRLMSGKFTLEDVYAQIEQMSNMGPLNKVMEMLPFGAKIPKELMQVQEEKLKRYRFVMDSMTPAEKQEPEIIKHERIERIARGAGTSAEDVRDLLNYYKNMKKMMKKFGSERKMERLMKRIGMGKMGF